MDDQQKVINEENTPEAQTASESDEVTSDTTPSEEASNQDAQPETTEETASPTKEEASAEEAPVQPAEESPETTASEDIKTVEEVSPENDQTAETPTEEIAQPAKSDNPNAKWYVVHTYSGHENKVALTLKQRVESEHLQEKILDVLVPTQEKIEIKSGKKVNVKEKIFPGYILVKMVLDDVSWLAVRTTQGVTSFVGMGNKPTPISEAEVATIVKFTKSEAPMYKQVFMANDTVKIVDGPFADFIGKIDSVDEEKGKVRVLVSIFGRETPVELDFLQIKKI